MTYGEWHKIMREQIANENLMELLGKIEKLEKRYETSEMDNSKIQLK
jgi:hypothetical protein